MGRRTTRENEAALAKGERTAVQTAGGFASNQSRQIGWLNQVLKLRSGAIWHWTRYSRGGCEQEMNDLIAAGGVLGS